MNNLTDEQIKQIVKDINDKEKREHNSDVQLLVITPLDYYDKVTKGKKIKLIKKAEMLISLLAAGGLYSKNRNEIVIFTNKYKKIKKTERKILEIAETCYHEFKHDQQNQQNDFSYGKFISWISDGFSSTAEYLLEHGAYYFEIEAKMYGYQKAKEYMQKNYPEEYEREKEYIEQQEKKVQFQYLTFDASDEIELSINRAKNILKEKKCTKIPKALYEASPVFEIFFNDDLSYKKISDIIQNENFQKVDRRIVHAIFSSKTFLEMLNFEELTNEELNILSESLEYTQNLYQKQADILLKEKDFVSVDSLEKIKAKCINI